MDGNLIPNLKGSQVLKPIAEKAGVTTDQSSFFLGFFLHP